MLEPAYVKPKRLHFGKISKHSGSKTLTAVITPGDGGPINPRIVPKEVKGVTAILKEIEAGKRYELEVTLKPPFEGTRVYRRVEIDSGVKAPRVQRVEVQG